MKKLLLSLLAGSFMSFSYGTVHVIINISNTSFSPSTVNAVSGDTLVFNLQLGHTATSVDQTTWNANGTTGNGAFSFSSPGGQYIIPGAFTGTIYYVCTVHVGITGMKGLVNVSPGSGISEKSNEMFITAFPNPAENVLTIKTEGLSGKMKVRILDVLGADAMTAATVDVSTYQLNVSALPSGTYFVRIENGDRTKVVRFVKK